MREYKYLETRVITYINSLINEENFSEEVFHKWLLENNVEFKSNPNTYVMSCFKKELEDGKFRPRVPVISVIPLFNDMRSKKIKVHNDDTQYISLMEQHLLVTHQVELDELKELNKKAIEYIAKKDKPSTKDFINVFVNSKRHFDLARVEKGQIKNGTDNKTKSNV